MATAAPPAVLCSHVLGHPRSPTANGRTLILGVAALPPYLRQTVADENGQWHYWSKTGLVVRGGTLVTISVPSAWRDRAAIGWGNPAWPVSSLRVARCTWMDFPWNVYAGGFFLRDRTACVPLVVRARGSTATVRVGVGRRC